MPIRTDTWYDKINIKRPWVEENSMKCTLCNKTKKVSDIHDHWLPVFFVGESEYGDACPKCSKKFLQVGTDGEVELKPEFLQSFRAWQDEDADDWDSFAIHQDIS